MKEASDYQILYYIFNNDITNEQYNLEEEKKYIHRLNESLSQKFVSLTENKTSSNPIIREFLQEKYVLKPEAKRGFKMASGFVGGTLVGGPIVGALVAWLISRSNKEYTLIMKDAKAKCKQYRGIDNKLCRTKYKVIALKKQIAILGSDMSKCSKTSAPDKCRLRLKQKISTLTKNLENEIGIMKQLENEVKQH